MDHSYKMSTCKSPKKFSNFTQKLAYVGRVLIKLWYSSIENHIRPRSFKILAMTVGQTFFEKKQKKKKQTNFQNLHKIQIISNSKWLSLKTLIKWSMEPSYSLIKLGNS